MGNKNRNKNRPAPAAAPQAQPPLPAAPAARGEPTSEQRERIAAAQAQVDGLTAERGPPVTDGIAEPPGASIEGTLKRVEALLKSARAHADGAKEHERKADLQRRDNDRAFDDRVRKLEGEHKTRLKQLDDSETDLLSRIEKCEGRESAATTKESELRSKESALSERAAHLTERELNAENGFLAEKTRVLKPLEDEVVRLRAERDRLPVEIAESRAAVEKGTRVAASARAQEWAQEDARRTEAAAEARRSLDDELVKVRAEKLAELRAALQVERGKAEADWKSRGEDLDEQARTLATKAAEVRRAEMNVKADEALLADDRVALDRKVERLVAAHTEDLRHELASVKTQLEDARAQRNAYFKDLESRGELDRRLGGRAPDLILADLTNLERERDELTQQLRARPDGRAGERLVGLERERSAWLEERAVLQGSLFKASAELGTRRLAAIELETLTKQKEALEVHKQLLDGAVNELRARVDELTRQDDNRNPMTALTSLDEDEGLQSDVRTTTPFGRATPSLREFADDLRHRIATGVEGRTLYYAARDVRAFLGGLAMTRLMLIQGISGTGKTSLPLAFASAVGGGIEVVEVQAGWRDRQDLVGYDNAFHRHYYATNFLQALYKAGTPAYRDRLFMMVLDEINLSRPEQFFADFLSALEQPEKDRKLTLVNDPVAKAPRLMVRGRHLPIPPNVWFVGTANHDESTTEFADKTYDRAHVMEMPRKTDDAQFVVQDKGTRNAISYQAIDKAFDAAVEKQAAAVQKATAWLRDASFASTLAKRFRVGWGNRLEHQLARYLPVVVESGGTVGEAMDHLLVTKVLRKLKDRHDVRAAALEELHDQLITAWDGLDKANPPERCDALIENEITAKKGEELV